MDHEAHVRFVDPHPEGDRRHDHIDLVPGEGVLVFGPRLVVEPRVVRHRVDPLPPQELGHLLDGPARQAVDDPALAPMAPDETEDFGARIPFPLLPDPRSAGSGGRRDPLYPSGFRIPSCRRMSAATRRVAVAVRARMGRDRPPFGSAPATCAARAERSLSRSPGAPGRKGGSRVPTGRCSGPRPPR